MTEFPNKADQGDESWHAKLERQWSRVVGMSAEDKSRAVLLEQFYSTLSVAYFAALQDLPADGSANAAQAIRACNQAILSDLKDLFEQKPPTWQNAYRIELELTQIMNSAQLDTEWTRRLAEAQALGLGHLNELIGLYPTGDQNRQNLETLPRKRAALQRLLNDLQWFYQQRIRRRDAAKTLAKRVSWLFWFSFVLFVAILFFQISFGPHDLLTVGDS